ncbi:hypothetical protein [Gaoshiqia sediminis]|uniref:Mobilization protein n=1 Tax=Gaoshiqia sediminis TaxID=2986998 RepID=A0AA41Y5S9_9BACT|nr:hypothetical protein [Gaoshiqia sediminis]MCW0482370.1 hypothetical protein [Gaoshiqia sediminis]
MLNTKYIEYIAVYVSVLFGCVVMAVIVRLSVLALGVDEFTANVIFFATIFLLVIIYSILILVIDGLYNAIAKRILFYRKNTSISAPSPMEVKDFNKIREDSQKAFAEKEQSVKEVAIRYTQKKFAPYTSNEQLDLLCHYIAHYSEGKQLQVTHQISVIKLSNLDIYHFGWNIWNYLKISNQAEIAFFSKVYFMVYSRMLRLKRSSDISKTTSQKESSKFRRIF